MNTLSRKGLCAYQERQSCSLRSPHLARCFDLMDESYSMASPDVAMTSDEDCDNSPRPTKRPRPEEESPPQTCMYRDDEVTGL